MAILTVSRLSVSVGGMAVLSDVSFAIDGGETLGLVGESGCGKSMLALAVMGLLPPEARIDGGALLLENENLLQMTPQARRRTRGGRMAMIFQEPMTSLNPVMPVGAQLAEAILCHEKIGRRAAQMRALELLKIARIADAKSRLRAFPHELSGGMRQRVMIAMALACRPALLVADEPTTALDVTVQGQILALLADLRCEFNMAMLMITHDLGVLSQIADRILVMYRGEIIERADATKLLAAPMHPYTAGLIACAPTLDSDCTNAPLPVIAGRLPALAEKIEGCAFHPRCARARDRCKQESPPLSESQTVRCFYPLVQTA